MLFWRGADRSVQHPQTVQIEPAISVHKHQYWCFRGLNSTISRGGNAGMSLSDNCERITVFPVRDVLRCSFPAAIIDNNDLKTRRSHLLRQRS